MQDQLFLVGLVEDRGHEILDDLRHVDHDLVAELGRLSTQRIEEFTLDLARTLAGIEEVLELDVALEEKGEVQAVGADRAEPRVGDFLELLLDLGERSVPGGLRGLVREVVRERDGLQRDQAAFRPRRS